jgi:enoyl-CoA hydratase
MDLRSPDGPEESAPDETERVSAMSTSYECLRIERHGAVGWLINNRPERLNAMNAKMRDEFAVAWRELDEDPSVRVIVHTGEGKAFQTGVDVLEIASDGVGMERYRQSVEDFDLHFTSWHNNVWKPVITAVNGICAGGGFHWVADADIVIAASDAQFFDPHVSVGQVVSLEAIGLTRKMPFEAVMRMALVGRHERIDAKRARDLGMISQIVDPPERLREEAQALAEKIAKNSPAAMRATKKALWGALESGLTDACRQGTRHLVSMWGHPDQTEGPLAFAEKREPRWAPPEDGHP